MGDFSIRGRQGLWRHPRRGELRWPQLSAEWNGGCWRLAADGLGAFSRGAGKNAALLPGRALKIRLLRKNLPELLKGAVPDTDRAWQVFALLMTVLVS